MGRAAWEAQIKTRNDQQHINREKFTVRITLAEVVAMNPPTPKTESPPAMCVRLTVFPKGLRSSSQALLKSP